MRDDSFLGESVDDRARRSTLRDVDVLSAFGVGDRFVQVGVGPEAETGDGQNSNDDYQQYEPLHVCLRKVSAILIWIDANSGLIRYEKVAQDHCRCLAVDQWRYVLRLHTFGY